MKGVMVPCNFRPSSSRAVTLWWRWPHLIPCQLQNWIESFHEVKIPYGSLAMDSLNLSKAKRSVSFVGVVGCKHSRVIVKSRIIWRCVELNNSGKLGLWEWSFIGLDKQERKLVWNLSTRQSWIRKFVSYIGSLSNVVVVNCKESFQLKKTNLSWRGWSRSLFAIFLLL